MVKQVTKGEINIATKAETKHSTTKFFFYRKIVKVQVITTLQSKNKIGKESEKERD